MAIQTISRAQVSGGRPYIRQTAKEDAQRRDQPKQRGAEGALDFGVGEAEHQHAGADDRKGQEGADGNQFAQQPDGEQARHEHREVPVRMVASQGVRNLGWTALNIGGSRPSLDMV